MALTLVAITLVIFTNLQIYLLLDETGSLLLPYFEYYELYRHLPRHYEEVDIFLRLGGGYYFSPLLPPPPPLPLGFPFLEACSARSREKYAMWARNKIHLKADLYVHEFHTMKDHSSERTALSTLLSYYSQTPISRRWV